MRGLLLRMSGRRCFDGLARLRAVVSLARASFFVCNDPICWRSFFSGRGISMR